MPDLLGTGTNRGYSMAGIGIGIGISEFRLKSIYDPRPTFEVNWAETKTIDSVLGSTPSFSRASSGWSFDSNGTAGLSSINVARFQHVFNGTSWISRGLLIEEQRTNSQLRSIDFSNASWTKRNNTITTGAAVAPDGTTTANKFAETTTNASHDAYPSASVNAGTTVVHSVFAKAAERNWLFLAVDVGKNAHFDLSTGTVGTVTGTATAVMEPWGNGWYRCELRVTSAQASNQPVIGIATGDGVNSYAGTTGSGIFVWQASYKPGAYSTSMITTTGSSATRSADVCQITGSGFSNIWNPTEGTLVFEGVCPASGTLGLLSMNDTTANERMELYASGTSAKFIVVDGGATQADITAGTITAGTPFKLACRYKANDFAISLNGAAAVTDVSGTLPTVTQMVFGSNQAGNSQNGTISRVRYYGTAYSDAIIQGFSA